MRAACSGGTQLSIVSGVSVLEYRTQKWTPLFGSIRCSFSKLAHRSERTRRAALAKTGPTFPHDALRFVPMAESSLCG